jgi:hypothetical protein
VYIGETKGPQKNGLGTFINQALEYSGTWLNDDKSGKGTLNHLGKFVVEGTWLENQLTYANKLTEASGDVYVGPMAKNMFSGEGRLD